MVLLLYFLVLSCFTRESEFAGSIVLSISPWHIIISRATSEGIIAVFFVMLGIIAFIKATASIKIHHGYMQQGSLLFCKFSFSYHAARIFVPSWFFPGFFIVSE